jgi:hypothetical protein
MKPRDVDDGHSSEDGPRVAGVPVAIVKLLDGGRRADTVEPVARFRTAERRARTAKRSV